MRLHQKFHIQKRQGLEVPVGFISHVSTVPLMSYPVMVSFKGATMHVAGGVWQMTLSLRDITL